MTGDGVRVDRWLSAARVFKSRSQATQACGSGRVSLNGTSVKAHHAVRIGDRLDVHVHDRMRELEVKALAEKRLSPALARELYEDHSPPPPPREKREAPPIHRDPGLGRPTKRDRRALKRLRGR